MIMEANCISSTDLLSHKYHFTLLIIRLSPRGTLMGTWKATWFSCIVPLNEMWLFFGLCQVGRFLMQNGRSTLIIIRLQLAQDPFFQFSGEYKSRFGRLWGNGNPLNFTLFGSPKKNIADMWRSEECSTSFPLFVPSSFSSRGILAKGTEGAAFYRSHKSWSHNFSRLSQTNNSFLLSFSWNRTLYLFKHFQR